MDFFTTYLYQPFFNLLVGIYWLVGQVFPNPDMGIAMIFFAIAVRIIFLPLDLIGERSDEDKFQISEKIKKIKIEYAADPIMLKAETGRIMRQKPGAILSEIFNVIFQLTVIIMLYRIFTTGLEGADLHLIYKFMPKIHTPINLMFLGIYDLSHTNNTLNLIQSLMVAANETMHLYFSPVKPSQKDFVSLVIIFPVICYVIFMFLPAGKKVYIITSLAFSMIVKVVKQLTYLYYSFSKKSVLVAVSENQTPTSSEKTL